MADDEAPRVELEAYSGPLDLLLYLVQKEEVDVHDIPVARILERYLEALRATPVTDLDRAGEFLVMASTLMSIKAAMLLPATEVPQEDLVDPREELVRQLVEYRRAREEGERLGRLRDAAALRWPRGSAPLPEPPEEDAPEPPGVREVTLFDVFAAFHRLLRETEGTAPRRIVYDDVPQEVHVRRILGVVERGGGAAGLRDLLGERRDRPFVLGTFLAVLELMKEGRLLAIRAAGGDDIRVLGADSAEGRAVLEALRAAASRREELAPAPPRRRGPPWKRGGEEGEAGPPVETGDVPPAP